jgi:hypothetical protein
MRRQHPSHEDPRSWRLLQIDQRHDQEPLLVLGTQFKEYG